MTTTSSDLTVILVTANEHPARWVKYHREVLDKAIEGHSLLTVSRTPGGDIHDTQPKSHLNMYKQLLEACRMADTKYIATAEDDALYPPDHFNFFRPKEVAYDMSRWSLYWWKPIYSVKQRISNCTLIANREVYIRALEERIPKMEADPQHISEVGRYERWLGVTPVKVELPYCEVPTVHFNPPNATDPLAKQHRKRLGQLKAYDIPYWGKAEDIISHYGFDNSI